VLVWCNHDWVLWLDAGFLMPFHYCDPPVSLRCDPHYPRRFYPLEKLTIARRCDNPFAVYCVTYIISPVSLDLSGIIL
jgi:hypothetical protein